jgi:endoglucanase
LWNSYASLFLESTGRIVDPDRGSSTTSEGQAYGLFFSLVANDRPRFEKILRWTGNNLSRGELGNRLPAWHWGLAPDGNWRTLDENSASDADLWLAYTLLQAGRLWQSERYTRLGTILAGRIAESETARIEGLGATLLPAPKGFHPESDLYRLNASYLPLQLLDGMAAALPSGPWADIAARVPQVVEGSSAQGMILDWIDYRVGRGFTTYSLPAANAVASYDAIRVYLWAGTLAPGNPSRKQIIGSMKGMLEYLRATRYPPAVVSALGTVQNARGSAGFSAALVPFLVALGEQSLAKENTDRVHAALNPKTGLYGKPARYYDQNLVLFAMGWLEKRYEFDLKGRLIVNWRSRCDTGQLGSYSPC